ncbi:MAG: alpha/beta hydrolase [Hyphomonadaceae bacterium]
MEQWDFGRGLAGYVWRAQNPRANLLIAHGFAEYAERYGKSFNGLVPRLNEMGFDVYAFDMRGHGRSAGTRGVVDVRKAVEDYSAARAAIAADGKPLFLFGHSLGGLVAAASALERPDAIAGVILSAPALQVTAPAHLRAIAGLVAAIAPAARIAPPLDVDKLSHMPEEVAAYRADPMISDPRVPALTGASVLAVSDTARQRYTAWRSPVLVLHGLKDEATDPEGSKRFIAAIPATDKQLELYPEGYHELLNDLERDTVRDVILTWLGARAA